MTFPSADTTRYPPLPWRVLPAVLLFLLVTGVGVGIYSPPSSIGATRSEKAYQDARKAYKRLARSARLRTDRRAWLKVIKGFRKVYLTYPDDRQVAPKCLYMMARTYRELYGYSKRRADLSEAVERYEVLIERFPDSQLADDALYALGFLYLRVGKKDVALDAWAQLVTEYPKSRYTKKAIKRLARYGVKKVLARLEGRQEGGRGSPGYNPTAPPKVTAKGPRLIQEVKHWSEEDYTRVVIHTTGPVTYKEGSLPADRKRGLPRRFYLDIKPARKSKALGDRIVIRDGLLKGVRLGQYRRDTVRAVFDLGGSRKVKAFYLEDPFRIVVDAFGENYGRKSCPPPPKKKARTRTETRGKKGAGGLTLAQQLGLCIGTVVVDAGHGGKDPGAVGPSGLKEKDVTLRVARKVAALLKKQLGVKVILTRSGDRFLPLEQRTAIANAKKADLFISIHTNAARNRRLRGVETYFLNFALDDEAMQVAARENATSSKRIGQLRSILNDIMKNAKVEESSRLAQKIQKGLVASLKGRYSGVRNHGVKQAPFFVLIGARMPSVLVEISFISNRVEEKRLKSGAYLDRVAQGIVDGVRSYVMDTRMAYRAE